MLAEKERARISRRDLVVPAAAVVPCSWINNGEPLCTLKKLRIWPYCDFPTLRVSTFSESWSLESDEKQPRQVESNGDPTTHTNGKGGFISATLVLGTSLGLGIASGAWYSNLMVLLISEFNIKNIAAAQINNIFSGFTNFFPFVVAVVSDSFFGSFSIILTSSFVSLAGVIMFALMFTIYSLRPPPCAPNSSLCVPPSSSQYSFLYIALTLASLGLGGTRFILGTMGADQFERPKLQASFFNWFVFILYVSWIIGYTLLIYIQGSVSWALSFWIALAANVIAIILFLLGARMYRKIPSQGSPFTSIARVFVAAIRNMKVKESIDGGEGCYLHESDKSIPYEAPSKSLRFLNRASLIRRGNMEARDEQTKSWRLCTVEEVQDLKRLIKIMPLWSTSIFLSTPIGVIQSLTVLMALVMDRNIGSHFKIPAGTYLVIALIVTAITTSILDRFIYPAYKKLTGRHLTHLQAIGVGHVCNILASIGFALIERNRLELVKTHKLMDRPNSVAPLSALWLAFPLAILGIGEGVYFPAEVALYYQEFPKPLRSTSTAMISLHFAAGYYLSSAVFNLVGRVTSWLPNDINHGRVDNLCWLLAVMAALNFAYFLLCSTLYKYNNRDPELDDVTSVPR